MASFCERLKQLREEKGMTLEELGNLVGVGKSTVRKWEIGMIANMKRDKIAKVANALGVTPAYLLGWSEAPVETTKFASVVSGLQTQNYGAIQSIPYKEAVMELI